MVVTLYRYCNKEGNSVIHWASRRNRTELLSHLIEKEVQNIEDKEYRFHVGQGSRLFKEVLDEPDFLYGATPLFQTRSAEGVGIFLKYRIEKDCVKLKLTKDEKGEDGQPLLHYCAEAVELTSQRHQRLEQ